MKKSLLITASMVLALAGQSQLQNASLEKAFSSGAREFAPGQPQQNNATVMITDTLHYFFNKHYYKNSPAANANTQFYTIKSPYQVSSLNLTHAGSLFLNTGTVTVHGLEGLVMRQPTSTNASVGVKLYLYNVNSSNLPIMPALDSVLTTVSTSTAGVWVGANFSSPQTMTANFAIAFRVGSTTPGDTIRLFLNNAATPTSTYPTTQKYGEGMGLMRWNTPVAWDPNTGNFGAGTDYEFIVAPRVSWSYNAGIGVLTPSICNNAVGSFSNMSAPMSLLENRQFNFNKFAAYWAPTNTIMPSTDSIYNWSFTGASPPATNAKHPTVLFNTAGNQTASLSVRYWYSVTAGLQVQPTSDGTSATIFVDASNSPNIAVSGATNICSGQSTTLTVSGNPTFTWTNPPSNANSIVVSPTSLTVYTVQANNGGCTAVKHITVQVSPAPTVQVTGPSGACVGNAFVITASGAQSYMWSNTSIAPSLTLSTQTPGVLSYTVTGSSGSCPTSTAVKSITIHALPSVSLTAASNTACTKNSGGTAVALNGIPTGGLYSGINVTGAVFTPSNPGTFPISYAYTDPATNCSANAAISITVVTCVVGLPDEKAANVSVFPNPTVDGVIYLQNLDGVTSLTLFNILGDKILSETVTGGQHRLDLSSLPQGQYFVRLGNSEGASHTVKIVNQR